MDLMHELARTLAATAADVLPVAVFMLFFYRIVLKQKLTNRTDILVGLGFVMVGLALLLIGVDKALFPAGRMMVEQLSPIDGHETAATMPPWSSYGRLYLFAFCITFAAALAEPALLAVATRANEISGGSISIWGLRVAAALGVASGVTLGCIRIVTGIPLHWCIAAAFMIIIVQTLFAPRVIVPLAYDSGGVSTTVVTVPIVTALGLGLADLLPARSALLDGFGLVAFACLCPAITVLAYAQMASLVETRWSRRNLDVKPRDATDRKG